MDMNLKELVRLDQDSILNFWIVLTGDSAGGNLCAAVTIVAIQKEFVIPDGLLMCYPALNPGEKYSSSLLFTLEDRLIPVGQYSLDIFEFLKWIGFLECCKNSYARNPDDLSNPRLSPSLASDEILSKFPPCKIVVGEKDPLRDQGFKFAKRLKSLSVSGELIVYELFPHGFLSFDSPRKDFQLNSFWRD